MRQTFRMATKWGWGFGDYWYCLKNIFMLADSSCDLLPTVLIVKELITQVTRGFFPERQEEAFKNIYKTKLN